MPGVKVAVFDFKLSSQMIWSTQGKKKKNQLIKMLATITAKYTDIMLYIFENECIIYTTIDSECT